MTALVTVIVVGVPSAAITVSWIPRPWEVVTVDAGDSAVAPLLRRSGRSLSN